MPLSLKKLAPNCFFFLFGLCSFASIYWAKGELQGDVGVFVGGAKESETAYVSCVSKSLFQISERLIVMSY